MDAKTRIKIVKQIAKLRELSYEEGLCSFLLDELCYSEWNIKTEGGGEEEIKKICQAYGVTEKNLPKSIIPYIQRIRNWKPSRGVMDHYDINDSVSYIGVYYDGEPTAKYRKKGRYGINPIKIKDIDSTLQE